MIIFKQASSLHLYIKNLQQQGSTVGFVPTMGALHAGHLSLIQTAISNNSLAVCSIFVNPTQFNDPADFQRYPITLEQDIELLERAGTAVLFLPDVATIYPNGTNALPRYELGYLETILEGAFRPGHFQGVCQVMQQLLEIVQPNNLYMGQKDYQQCMVVKRLLEIMESPTRLHTGVTLREADGLAMSSRNLRLKAEERQKAAVIYQALTYIKEHLQPGNEKATVDAALRMLTDNNYTVDYVALASAHTLEIQSQWDGNQKLIALIAAFQNEVRLIDNMLLHT